MSQCAKFMKTNVFSPESGYRHKSLMAVDGSIDVKGFPCQMKTKGVTKAISQEYYKFQVKQLLIT